MKAKIQVPGEMIATYDNGKITGWTFSPLATSAGYFGPAAICIETDVPEPPIEENDGSLPEWDLGLEWTDGPFWKAVQDDSFHVEWQE